MPYKMNPPVPNKAGGQMDPSDIKTADDVIAYLDLAFDAGLILVLITAGGNYILANKKELDG
jgi:hypothetical protein